MRIEIYFSIAPSGLWVVQHCNFFILNLDFGLTIGCATLLLLRFKLGFGRFLNINSGSQLGVGQPTFPSFSSGAPTGCF
ncbi:hypothetical protein ACHQM5_013684 [Ranunculus cassubicifolius]